MTHIDHAHALDDYVRRLNTHRWTDVAPLVSDDAVFIFSEGTHIGKAAAKVAFEKTFAHIEDETYWTTDVQWTAVTNTMACCHFLFHWHGKIEGKEQSGEGRGSSTLIKLNGRWLIAQEHLGPKP